MENKYQLKSIDNEIIIAGATIRTTNVDGKSIKDHTEFWQRFYKEDIPSKILNICDSNNVYGVYTNYESDYMGWYDFTIGFQVNSIDGISDDITIIKIPKKEYAVFEIKEAFPLYEKIGMLWKNIWSADINREYDIDFEIYDNTKILSDNPDIKIFISK